MSKASRFLTFCKEFKKKKDYPSVANFDITSRCNLNCEHCYWRKTYNSKKELSEREWEKIFLRHMGRETKAAFLTGGEPALRPNVIRLADRIFNSITIVSNGTIKIPEDIQRRIFISIDGPREIHNRIRGVKVFDKVLKNIQDDKRVVLAPTLSMTNYKYIRELVDIARTSNVDGITFSTYTSHQVNGDPLLLQGKELDWTINELRRVRKKNKDMVWLTPRMINLFKTKKYSKKCLMWNPKNTISFDANMNVKKPCVLGKGVNCKTCGCIVPVMAYALKHADLKAWFLFDKFYPERYYKGGS